MKIGIVGYQGSGKSTLFQWLTGVAPDPALAHAGQSAMAAIPSQYIEPLCKIYAPKKVTRASLELMDTPGLSRSGEGNAKKLALLREVGCFVLVVRGFEGGDPRGEITRFQQDLLLADLEIVSGRMERVQDQFKRPRPAKEREADQAELAALTAMHQALEAGQPASSVPLTEEQRRATRSFALLTEKPHWILVNIADDDTNRAKYQELAKPGETVVAVPLRLELDLAQMSPEDRMEFEKEMGLVAHGHDVLIQQIMDASGQMIYFTAGDKEVRTWLLRKGGTALEAAENIHTDLARGFIRAETMQCDDLIRLGSERDIKAQGLMRSEPKDYVVKDGDILHIRFSV